MTTQRFSSLLLVLAACGPSTPATDAPATDASANEPAAAVVGKGSLVFHLTRSKTVEGKFNVTDISESCTPTGTVTFAEIPKAGGKGRGTIDVTVTCKGVDLLREPLVIKGEFSDVPLRNK